MVPGARRPVTAVAALAIAFAVPNAYAEGTAPAEYAVKAAFLYNFAKFVEWPAEALGGPGAPMKIGILGEDPFGSVLDQAVKDKNVNGRPLVVRRLQRVEDARSCHIVFISRSKQRDVGQILATVRGAPVLTVGDMERFAHQGGMVNLLLEQNKVRFEVNLRATEIARLKLSSQVLQLARMVGG